MNKTQNLFKISLSALFVAVIAISALITVPAPVPFTLQTLGIFVACFFLGFKWSLFSVSAYLLIGAVGLPVFAGFQGGFAALFGPTGGFIIGFLFIPLLNGILSLIFPKKFAPLYLLLGLLCCYLLGSLWFTVYSGKTSFFVVFFSTFAAYIVPDVIKLVLAKKIAKLLNRATAKLGLFGNDILSPVKIKSAIQNKVELFVFDTVDSTNTAAAKAIKNGVALPALFVAQNQTHGRGRRGRSFYSNGGLYMTLALPTNAENNLSVTTLCSVAVAEAIE